MEHQDSHERRILALLKRQPGMTVGEIAASLSGLVQHEVRRALARMRDKKLVDREGTPNLWFAVEVDEATQPEPRPNVYKIPQYKPAYEAPARSDALDHTLVGSRRGDELVGFSVPKGIESIPVKSSAPVAEKKRSPINGSTFCKRIPIPVMVRP